MRSYMYAVACTHRIRGKLSSVVAAPHVDERRAVNIVSNRIIKVRRAAFFVCSTPPPPPSRVTHSE